jgi:anaerobic selenocysteine-containing dehydrogenase
LHAAAPETWIEVSREDARAYGLAEGDRARVESARGYVEAAVRISGIRPGVLFTPFHYGAWDHAEDPTHTQGRAGNELTPFGWDPVSKQPPFKVSAVSLTRTGNGDGPAPAPTTGGSAPADPDSVPATVGGPRAHAASRMP